jgi:hypothetical protein
MNGASVGAEERLRPFVRSPVVRVLMPPVLPRLVPIRGGSFGTILLSDNSESDPLRRFPAAMLDLLWAILSEDPAYWPYKIEDTLDRLAAAPETSEDPRLSELRRRRHR